MSTGVECVGCGLRFTWLDDSGLCYRCQSNPGSVSIKTAGKQEFHHCRVCGASLRSKRKGAQFCSSLCKQKFHRVMNAGNSLICEWCDKRFSSKRKDAKYCSPKCKQAAYRVSLVKPVIDFGYEIPRIKVQDEGE